MWIEISDSNSNSNPGRQAKFDSKSNSNFLKKYRFEFFLKYLLEFLFDSNFLKNIDSNSKSIFYNFETNFS